MRSNDAGCFLVRLGLGIVFVLFGFDKLPHPENWIVYYPLAMTRYFGRWFDGYQFLRFQGLVEAIIGGCLVIGFLTRFAAFFSTVILGLIIYFLGKDPLAVRDTGLFFASAAVFLMGSGKWSMDHLIEKYGDKGDYKGGSL